VSRRVLLPLAVAATVAVGSLLPGAAAPTAAGLPWDKFLHATGGAALVLAGAWAVRRRDPRTLVLLACVAAALGGLLEVGQAFVPSRDPAVGDFLADALGAALAALAVAVARCRS